MLSFFLKVEHPHGLISKWGGGLANSFSSPVSVTVPGLFPVFCFIFSPLSVSFCFHACEMKTGREPMKWVSWRISYLAVCLPDDRRLSVHVPRHAHTSHTHTHKHTYKHIHTNTNMCTDTLALSLTHTHACTCVYVSSSLSFSLSLSLSHSLSLIRMFDYSSF